MTMPDPEWRVNEFGDSERALYIGGLFVGAIHHMRDKWRGWVMDDPDGNAVCEGGETLWFATPEDAREAVQAAVLRLLTFS